MNKKNIAIIFGGCSPEYSVSLKSAYAIISHVDRSRYTPALIGITPDGCWFHFDGDIQRIAEDTWRNSSDCRPVMISPNRTERSLLMLDHGRTEKLPIDAAFPVLHGKNGEDGTVQGVFALAGIPLVGCGVLASALCMDKDRAHKLAFSVGIAVPASYVLDQNMDKTIALKWAEQLGYPLFVKPVKAGSSYGITRVSGSDELAPAIKQAFEYDENVIIEEAISGFEVGCAILGNDKLIVGEVDEIELTDGFFDFAEKYTLKTSAIHVPARIDRDLSEQVKHMAKAIYRALDCRGFARVDMFLRPDGRIVFNEVNTIPGFTTHSRLPNMLKAVGMSFEEIVSTVIELAVEK